MGLGHHALRAHGWQSRIDYSSHPLLIIPEPSRTAFRFPEMLLCSGILGMQTNSIPLCCESRNVTSTIPVISLVI